MRTVALGFALALGFTTVASAAIAPAPIGNAGSAIVKVAEGCGRGFWRGPNGRWLWGALALPAIISARKATGAGPTDRQISPRRILLNSARGRPYMGWPQFFTLRDGSADIVVATGRRNCAKESMKLCA